MSEQKPTSFMQELDQWTDQVVMEGETRDMRSIDPADRCKASYGKCIFCLRHSTTL